MLFFDFRNSFWKRLGCLEPFEGFVTEEQDHSFLWIFTTSYFVQIQCFVTLPNFRVTCIAGAMLSSSFSLKPRKINGEKLTMMSFTFLDVFPRDFQLPSDAVWKVNFKTSTISNCVRSIWLLKDKSIEMTILGGGLHTSSLYSFRE